MTQASLGGCQHLPFSPALFSHDFEIILNDSLNENWLIKQLCGLGCLVLSASHILLYVPPSGLLPHCPCSLWEKTERPTNLGGITLGYGCWWWQLPPRGTALMWRSWGWDHPVPSPGCSPFDGKHPHFSLGHLSCWLSHWLTLQYLSLSHAKIPPLV